jgi:hypothetical protein
MRMKDNANLETTVKLPHVVRIVKYALVVRSLEVVHCVNMEDNALNVKTVEVYEFVNIVECALDIKIAEELCADEQCLRRLIFKKKCQAL